MASGSAPLFDVHSHVLFDIDDGAVDEQMALGKETLGIYYGAAHMPDFEERLLARGFTKTGERWLTAWDLRKRPDPVAPRYRKDKD